MDNHINFLTPKEVALILRLNLLTVYEYIRRGGLQSVRFGRSYRIREGDLDKFITNHLSRIRKKTYDKKSA